MSELAENIKRINTKLQQLLRQYQVLQKENEQLKAVIVTLKTHHENDTIQINQLQQQAGILKSAAGKMNETDKKVFEKNINQYIREIDKCIALLSE
jgi:prefoldin subunit 5